MDMRAVLLNNQLKHTIPGDEDMTAENLKDRKTLGIFNYRTITMEVYYLNSEPGCIHASKYDSAGLGYLSLDSRGTNTDKYLKTTVKLSSDKGMSDLLEEVIKNVTMQDLMRVTFIKDRILKYNVDPQTVINLVIYDLMRAYDEKVIGNAYNININRSANDYMYLEEMFDDFVNIELGHIFNNEMAKKFSKPRREKINFISFGNKTMVEIYNYDIALPVSNDQMIIDIEPFWFTSDEVTLNTAIKMMYKMLEKLYSSLKSNIISDVVAVSHHPIKRGYLIVPLSSKPLFDGDDTHVLSYRIVKDTDTVLEMEVLCAFTSSNTVEIHKLSIEKDSGEATTKVLSDQQIFEVSDDYYYDDDNEDRPFPFSESIVYDIHSYILDKEKDSNIKEMLFTPESEFYTTLRKQLRITELMNNEYNNLPSQTPVEVVTGVIFKA